MKCRTMQSVACLLVLNSPLITQHSNLNYHRTFLRGRSGLHPTILPRTCLGESRLSQLIWDFESKRKAERLVISY